MLFAGSIALSACGEQASQDLAPPPGSEAIPSAETAPTEGAAPAEVAEGEAADAPAAVAEGEAADAPAAVAEGEAADAPAAVAEGEAAEVAPEAVSPGSPGQQERAQVARERRRANAPAETAGGADQAVAGPDEAEDIGAVAAYGGPALRAPVIPERERMVPLYGGPSIDIDDR